jgi:hypothetical protein
VSPTRRPAERRQKRARRINKNRFPAVAENRMPVSAASPHARSNYLDREPDLVFDFAPDLAACDGFPFCLVEAIARSSFSLIDSAIDLDAPLSALLLLSPRLADSAAPAAICWALDFAGMIFSPMTTSVVEHDQKTLHLRCSMQSIAHGEPCVDLRCDSFRAPRFARIASRTS